MNVFSRVWSSIVAAWQRDRWRTIDIVIASIIAVAFGVIFWAWNLLWTGPAEVIPLPWRALIYGVWLVPAVLGGLIIRKPGAAFYTLSLAALVSIMVGVSWGWTLVVQGPLEALGAELVFALFAYRVWRLPVALLAATSAGIVAGVYDAFFWYPETSWAHLRLPYIAITAVSSLVVAGFGSVLLTQALANTGVLDRFAAGRDRALV